MDDNRLTKLALNYNPQGRRRYKSPMMNLIKSGSDVSNSIKSTVGDDKVGSVSIDDDEKCRASDYVTIEKLPAECTFFACHE